MKKCKRSVTIAVSIMILSGCSGIPQSPDNDRISEGIVVPRSYLEVAELPSKETQQAEMVSADLDAVDDSVEEHSVKFNQLKSLDLGTKRSTKASVPRELFRNDNKITVAAERMPIREFIHYTFGELLGANYILDDSFEGSALDSNEVSLSIVDGLSARNLFDVVSDLLSQRGIELKYDSGAFFIFRNGADNPESRAVIGIGSSVASVPETSQLILQVVPLKFGIKNTTERTIRSLVKAKITPDYAQSAFFVEGRRNEVIQTLELVKLLDTPAMRSKYVGLIKLKHLSPEAFGKDVSTLLKNEGIDIGIGDPSQRNLVLVPIGQLNAVVLFSTSGALLERVTYWAGVIDIPNVALQKEYFVYNPMYARAVDLGKSISELISVGEASAGSERGNNRTTGNAPSSQRSGSFGSEDLSIVVDEKVNAIIFYGERAEFDSLKPLMRRLDVLPRQVMLDITIAEVSLKDEFKFGVEWALARKEVSITTQGAFGATSLGGMGLTINGAEGPLDASFLTTNSLVKVLSNPSIMVRDGVAASISVGSSVSVVGETTQDPINGERQTTRSVYRKTGVDVAVKPTINAQGIISMEISQNISNSVPGTAGSGGNPDIFERSVQTEIVAKNGQTVMLGGLISENKSQGESGVPFFSKIPLIGNLLKSDSTNGDRTELVMLITPKVIEDLTEWKAIKNAFSESLTNISLADEEIR